MKVGDDITLSCYTDYYSYKVSEIVSRFQSGKHADEPKEIIVVRDMSVSGRAEPIKKTLVFSTRKDAWREKDRKFSKGISWAPGVKYDYLDPHF
jgi:hypothetical protein